MRQDDQQPAVPALRATGWAALLCTVAAALAAAAPLAAQENGDCLMCHEDPEAVGTRGGKEISVFVDGADYTAWADNYGAGCGAAGDAVPEPAALALLAGGGLAVIRRTKK